MTLERFVLIFCLSVLTLFVVHDARAASSERIHIDDTKLQFCYGYIKQLKGLWFDIHQKGIEQTMIDHPPAKEGVDEEAALGLANEILAVDKTQAQEWIEMKWNACLDHPEGVGR
jgi:hypothetical protein